MQALRWYDGGTQRSIQIPDRAWQNHICAMQPSSLHCRRVLNPPRDAGKPDNNIDDLELRSELGVVERRTSGKKSAPGEVDEEYGVYALKDLSGGERLIYDAATSIMWTEQQMWGMQDIIEETGNVHLKHLAD